MPKTAQLACEEKEELLQAYQAVLASYLVALQELRKNVRILSKEDFDKAFYRMTEVLLQDVAAARFRLEAHMRQHCC
jgi:hypothetical protein